MLPGARSHEMVKATQDGVRAKLGIDATVPFAERDRYRRLSFQPTKVEWKDTADGEAALRWLD